MLDASGATSIDFTTIDDGKIEDVETIRLNGGVGTTITIDASDVITDFEAGALNPGGAGPGGNYGLGPILRVDGDAGDTLNLTGGDWSVATGSSGTPAGYTLYVHEVGRRLARRRRKTPTCWCRTRSAWRPPDVHPLRPPQRGRSGRRHAAAVTMSAGASNITMPSTFA